MYHRVGLFLLLRTFISALRLPGGQGIALHSAEDPLFQIGIGGREVEDQLLDLLTLGGLVHRAAVVDDGQLHAGGEIVHRLFVDVQHGPDLNDAGAIQVGNGLEATDAAFVDQRHHKGFHCVIIMVTQGYLVAA